jgi:hypothetical protein
MSQVPARISIRRTLIGFALALPLWIGAAVLIAKFVHGLGCGS